MLSTCSARPMRAILYGDTEGAAWLLELRAEKRDVSAIRDALVFGPEIAALLGAQGSEQPVAPGEARRKVA